MPWVAKIHELSRSPVNGWVRPGTLAARSRALPMGSAHQAYMRLSASVTATAARPITA